MASRTDIPMEVLKLFSLHSEPIQSFILDATAVSAGIFNLEGNALALNQGFRIAIGPDSDSSNITDCFINPTFHFFVQQAELTDQPLIYDGLITVGSELRNVSLKTRIVKRASHLLFLCEYDVQELDYINSEMQILNRKLNESQHQLIRKKKALSKSLSDLKRTQAKLVESEKMASLGRLVAGFAHEINTPIGIALTASSSMEESSRSIEQMLMQDEVEEDDLISTLEIIRDASKLVLSNLHRAADLVGSFKRTAIDQSTEKASVYSVNDTIADVLTSMRIKVKNTPIEVAFDSHEAISLYGNPGDIAQIVSNLYENSILHGFDNGKLPGKIRVGIQKEKDDILIHYSDEGKGMSAEVAERIYEPFFTTMRARGGTGLGMYICHKIVTSRLEGTIELTTAEGKGAEFLITVPVTNGEIHEAETI